MGSQITAKPSLVYISVNLINLSDQKKKENKGRNQVFVKAK